MSEIEMLSHKNQICAIEVIQDSRIQLHIKPVKVQTISNDLRQKKFEERSHYLEITGKSFRNKS